MMGLALSVVAAVATAAPVPPAPARWVEDGVGFLSPGVRDRLDERLEAYQRATGHQLVVWIGDSIGDAALDDWAVRTFAAWKVGRAGIDDGVVVFVLAGDRAIDIEIGYGLEDRVPDVRASRIIREVMTPRLQSGERDAAITEGVDALLAAIEGAPWTGPEVPPAPDGPSPLVIVLGVLGAIAFAIFAITHPRQAGLMLWGLLRLNQGNRHGRPRFGGGGGRSGGGGARGKW